jgi:uncharacterized protein YeaO (DUF488 family)
MKIYTGYFDILEKLPKDIIPISICGKAPGWYNGIQYKNLAPKLKFFLEWKENKDNNFYIKNFNEQVLSKLNKEQVLKDLYKISEGKDIILICYEKPDEFCHRHLVASWLNYNVEEYKI